MVRNCAGSAAVRIVASADPARPTVNVPALIKMGCPDAVRAPEYQHS